MNPHAGATDLTHKSEAEPIEGAENQPTEPAVHLPRDRLVAIDILRTDELILQAMLL